MYYNFKVIPSTINELNISFASIPEEENGRIKLNIDFETSATKTNKNLIIRRASSRSNFKFWEKIKIIPHDSISLLKHIWYDTTIESGIWYKYMIQ